MTYHEMRSIINIIGTILLNVVYAAYMFQRYPNADAYSAEVFRFWGSYFIILIPVAIVVKIIVAIIFAILHAIATRESQPPITDERDQVIDLKSNRNSLYVFVLGFVLAMALVAAGQPPTAMFVMLAGTGFVSDIFGELSQFFYYRRGV
jgi:uncharacterized membrane protein